MLRLERKDSCGSYYLHNKSISSDNISMGMFKMWYNKQSINNNSDKV